LSKECIVTRMEDIFIKMAKNVSKLSGRETGYKTKLKDNLESHLVTNIVKPTFK